MSFYEEMAGYIKGITIEIDGETKGLNAALKKINTTTRSLQGELKRVNSLLKLTVRTPEDTYYWTD